MKKFFSSIAVLILANVSFECFAIESKTAVQDVEIVESAPVETVLDHPDIRNTKEVWLEMLRNAKNTLDIEEFYVSSEKGEPMEDILSEIKKAAGRGVKIRIIADAGFYDTYPQFLDELGTTKNIEVRKIDVKFLTDGVMHAKYFIIDGEETFIGSQNFDWRSLKHTQEMGIRVKNREFAERSLRIFNLDWEIAKTNELPKFGGASATEAELQKAATDFIILPGGIKIKPVFSPPKFTPPNLPDELTEIVKIINSAKKDVFVQSMHYTPKSYGDYDATLDNAVRDAAARGKKVKLLISNWSLKYPNVNYLKSLSLIPNIEVKITTIPRFKDKYIPFARVEHSKFIVVDGEKAYVGSSNFEPNYFKKSRNVGVIIENPGLAGELRQIFFDSWTSPYADYIDPSKEYHPTQTGE